MAEDNKETGKISIGYIETLKKVTYNNLAQFVEDVNRNFAVVQNSPLFKGIPGIGGKAGDLGLRGVRGNQFLFIKLDSFNYEFPGELIAASKITLEFINSKLDIFENKQKLLNALGVSELVDNDIVVLSNSVMLSYNISNNNFIDTGIAFNEQSNLISNIQSKIEEYVKFYVDNNPSIIGIKNIFVDYETYAKSFTDNNSPYITKQLTINSIYTPYIPGVSNKTGIKLLNHKYFGFSDSEFPQDNNGTLVLGSMKKYHYILDGTFSTSSAQTLSSDYAPTLENIPSVVFLQDSNNNGLMFGLKDSKNLKNFASIFKRPSVFQDSNIVQLILKSDQGKNPSEYSELVLDRLHMEYRKLVLFQDHLKVSQDLHLFGYFNNAHIRSGEYTDGKEKTTTEIGYRSDSRPDGSIEDPKYTGNGSDTLTKYLSEFQQFTWFPDNVLVTTNDGNVSKAYTLEKTVMMAAEEESLVEITKIPVSPYKFLTSNYLGFIIRKINKLTQYCVDHYWRKNQFNTGDIPDLTLSRKLTVKGDANIGIVGKELIETNNITKSVTIGQKDGSIINRSSTITYNEFIENLLVTDNTGKILKTYSLEKGYIPDAEKVETPNSNLKLIKTINTNKFTLPNMYHLSWILDKMNNIIDWCNANVWRKNQFNTGEIPALKITGDIETKQNFISTLFKTKQDSNTVEIGDLNTTELNNSKTIKIPNFPNNVLITDGEGILLKTYYLENLVINNDEEADKKPITIYPSNSNNLVTSKYIAWIIRKINNINSYNSDNFWRKNQYNTGEIPNIHVSGNIKSNGDVRFNDASNPSFISDNGNKTTKVGFSGDTSKLKLPSNDISTEKYKNNVLVTDNIGDIKHEYSLEFADVADAQIPQSTTDINTEFTGPSENTKIVTSNYLTWIVSAINSIKLRFLNTFNKEETINAIYNHTPVGMMMDWYMVNGSIPDGWTPCIGGTFVYDGKTYNIPDLRGKFVKYGDEAIPNIAGGTNTINLKPENFPQHTHKGSVNIDHRHTQEGFFNVGGQSYQDMFLNENNRGASTDHTDHHGSGDSDEDNPNPNKLDAGSEGKLWVWRTTQAKYTKVKTNLLSADDGKYITSFGNQSATADGTIDSSQLQYIKQLNISSYGTTGVPAPLTINPEHFVLIKVMRYK